jgi:protein-tyrosine phosphatase
VSASSIRLSGAPNFRDLGGIKTRDGRRVRYGQLFRSGDSRALTKEDIARLAALDIKLVVDLRSIRESIGVDMLWPLAASAEIIEADVLADMRSGNKSLMDIVISNPTAAGADELMVKTYDMLPQALRKVLGQLAARLAHERKLPVVFHCTYGRDRTGFVAAMLLHALGVEKDLIAMNYLQTNDHIDVAATKQLARSQLQTFDIDMDDGALDNFTYARMENINAAYASMEAEFGTADEYLRTCGFDADIVQTLRTNLLEAA